MFNSAIKPYEKPPKFLTESEYSQLYNHLLTNGKNRKRNALLLHFLWFTGLRISDALSVKLKDVDFEKGILKVYIRKSRMKDTKELSNDLLLELLRYRDNQELSPDEKIFNVGRTDAFYIIRNAGLKSLGREISPHTLRHSTAMFLGQAMKDPRIVQRYLNHKDIRTTVAIYAGITDEQLKGAIRDSGLK